MTAPYTPDTLPQACADFTAQWEGDELWPYLDGAGNVTAGIGDLLKDIPALAKAIGCDLDAATTAWTAVKAMRPGMLPNAYRDATTLRLTVAVSQEEFIQSMPFYVKEAVSHISDFWTLDGNAQVGAVDVFYNAGYFRHMCDALSSRDCAMAAIQCHRLETPAAGGIQPARNAATKALILSAIPQAVS